jgi:hypothetical protein
MLSSIPNSFMFLMCVGWTSVRPVRSPALAQNFVARTGALPVSLGARAYQ